MARRISSNCIKGNVNSHHPRSAFNHQLSILALPLFSPPAREDVEQGGQILFQNFVREEFEQRGLHPPIHPGLGGGDDSAHYQSLEDVSDSNANSVSGLMSQSGEETVRSFDSIPGGYKNDIWSKYGRNLRHLADEFSNSPQGKKVRRQADGVQLRDINEQGFINLLVELFAEGFSQERLLALFTFCTALLLRAARENGMELTRYLFSWSLDYIRNRVCQWVYEHGGWEKVLGTMYNVLYKAAVIGVLFVAIGVGIVYIRKNW